MKKNSLSPVKMVVLIAIGAALYGLGGLIGIPVFANTTLKPAMAVLGLWAAAFGPVVGALVGLIGHLLTDIFAGWGVWVTWAIGSAIVGIIIGFYGKITKFNLEEGVFGTKEIVTFIVISFIANFLGYAFSALLDFILYTEPFGKVAAQQIIASLCNTLMIGTIGSIFMKLYANKNASKANLE